MLSFNVCRITLRHCSHLHIFNSPRLLRVFLWRMSISARQGGEGDRACFFAGLPSQSGLRQSHQHRFNYNNGNEITTVTITALKFSNQLQLQLHHPRFNYNQSISYLTFFLHTVVSFTKTWLLTSSLYVTITAEYIYLEVIYE